jgi:regulator of protease activity HflC (stomatin/prohibitin superfamily)
VSLHSEEKSDAGGPWLQAGRLAFVAMYIITIVVALRWGLSNVREVSPDARAVVLRFGEIDRVKTAGLLLAWPQPIEHVVTVPAAESVIERHVQALARSQRARNADMAAESDDEGTPIDDELAGSGYLLTGDAGIVQLDVRVFYKVTDPMNFVLQTTHVIPALDRIVTRNAVAVCAARDLDTILVARPELVSAGTLDNKDAESRERLRGDLLAGINRDLATLHTQHAGLGIEITRVDVQSTLPGDTMNAFNAVLTASQQAERNIADARTEAARIVQVATQTADRTVQVAHAQATERMAKAQTDTASVLQLAQSVKNRVEPGILLRVYRERMPAILDKAGSVTLVNPKDDSKLILQAAGK